MLKALKQEIVNRYLTFYSLYYRINFRYRLLEYPQLYILSLRQYKPYRLPIAFWLVPSLLLICYGPSVISVTVTKGGHPRGNRLYGTSKTIGQEVAELHS